MNRVVVTDNDGRQITLALYGEAGEVASVGLDPGIRALDRRPVGRGGNALALRAAARGAPGQPPG
jgi:hypothetical protein